MCIYSRKFRKQTTKNRWVKNAPSMISFYKVVALRVINTLASEGISIAIFYQCQFWNLKKYVLHKLGLLED